jgi:hypothetical protein
VDQPRGKPFSLSSLRKRRSRKEKQKKTEKKGIKKGTRKEIYKNATNRKGGLGR